LGQGQSEVEVNDDEQYDDFGGYDEPNVVNVSLELMSESISTSSTTNHTADYSRRFGNITTTAGFVSSTNTNYFC
jgi:hypothetical protein